MYSKSPISWTPTSIRVSQARQAPFPSADRRAAGASYAIAPGSLALAPGHPLIGHRLDLADPTWECDLAQPRLHYLVDHRVNGLVTFPGAGYVEAALAIARLQRGLGTVIIEELRFQEPLQLRGPSWPRLQLEFSEATASFVVYSKSPGEHGVKRQHASGQLGYAPLREREPVTLEDLRHRCACELSCSTLYSQMQERGLHYGSRFQSLRHIACGEGEVLALIGTPANAGHHLHPVILDAAFQSLLATSELAADGGDLYLPVRIQRLHFYGPPEGLLWSHATLTLNRRALVQADLVLFDDSGRVVVEVHGLQCLRVRSKSGRRARSAPIAAELSYS